MTRTRVKICGITRIGDAISAAELGVDAVGLVFCQQSPRSIDINTAKQIATELPPFVSTVGLFMDNSVEEINAVILAMNIELLQFHGCESAEFCQQFERPYLKALPMLETFDVREYAKQYQGASGYLLDAVKLGQAGGRGEVFSWNEVPEDLGKPLVLAGGLSASNVADVIKATRCYGVDVSSGVESSKGIKDAVKMSEFIEQVKRADNENG